MFPPQSMFWATMMMPEVSSLGEHAFNMALVPSSSHGSPLCCTFKGNLTNNVKTAAFILAMYRGLFVTPLNFYWDNGGIFGSSGFVLNVKFCEKWSLDRLKVAVEIFIEFSVRPEEILQFHMRTLSVTCILQF